MDQDDQGLDAFRRVGREVIGQVVELFSISEFKEAMGEAGERL